MRHLRKVITLQYACLQLRSVEQVSQMINTSEWCDLHNHYVNTEVAEQLQSHLLIIIKSLTSQNQLPVYLNIYTEMHQLWEVRTLYTPKSITFSLSASISPISVITNHNHHLRDHEMTSQRQRIQEITKCIITHETYRNQCTSQYHSLLQILKHETQYRTYICYSSHSHYHHE